MNWRNKSGQLNLNQIQPQNWGGSTASVHAEEAGRWHMPQSNSCLQKLCILILWGKLLRCVVQMSGAWVLMHRAAWWHKRKGTPQWHLLKRAHSGRSSALDARETPHLLKAAHSSSWICSLGLSCEASKSHNLPQRPRAIQPDSVFLILGNRRRKPQGAVSPSSPVSWEDGYCKLSSNV